VQIINEMKSNVRLTQNGKYNQMTLVQIILLFSLYQTHAQAKDARVYKERQHVDIHDIQTVTCAYTIK
jgi:hypothetical protein